MNVTTSRDGVKSDGRAPGNTGRFAVVEAEPLNEAPANGGRRLACLPSGQDRSLVSGTYLVGYQTMCGGVACARGLRVAEKVRQIDPKSLRTKLSAD